MLLRATLAAVVFLGISGPVGAGPASAGPQGFWTGEGHAVRTADLQLVTIVVTYDSRFWFVVKADNTIDGEATVDYRLDANDSVLRGFLAQANVAGGGPLSAIPGIGGLLGAGLATRDVIGMRLAYQETAPVRKARITGRVSEGRIHLSWAEPRPPTLAYRHLVVYPLKQRLSKVSTHPAYSPWLAEAAIEEPLAGQLVATTAAGGPTHRRENVTTVANWSARRPTAGQGAGPRP